MKGLVIALPALASLLLTNVTYAGCASGAKPLTASVLLEESYPSYYRVREDWRSGSHLSIETEHDFAEYKQKVDRFEKRFTEYQKDLVGCLNSGANDLLVDRIAHMELKDGKPVHSGRHTPEQFRKYIAWKESGAKASPIEKIDSGDDYVASALELVAEIRGSYPEINTNIAQRQHKLKQQRLATEKANRELEAKRAKEKMEAKKLQAEIDKRLELEAELRAAQAQREHLENKDNSPSPSTSTYIEKPAGQQAFNSGLNNTRSGDGYIKKQRVICFSKSAHDRQIEMLVDGIKQFAPGCFSTPEIQNAWMRDSSWGECVVQRVSDNKRIWTDCGDFVYW